MTESAATINPVAIASPVLNQVEEEKKSLEPAVEQPIMKEEEVKEEEALAYPVLDQVEKESQQEHVLEQPSVMQEEVKQE